MSEDAGLFHIEDKLSFIMDELNLGPKDVARKFGVGNNTISHIKSVNSGKCRPMHIYAFSAVYDVPMEIFEPNIYTKDEIRDFLHKKREKTKRLSSVFTQEKKIAEKLTTTKWYFYSYLSHGKLIIVPTNFYEDFTLKDECKNCDNDGNVGHYFIGKRDTIIVKESANAKRLTATIFENDKINSKILPFSRISKTGNSYKELANFGFLSTTLFSTEDAITIMGSIDKTQLKIDNQFLERVGDGFAHKLIKKAEDSK